jgi:hypothetical protein
MQDLSNGLHCWNVFSKIDLVKGYHQIPDAAADIPKTAIITPFGLFEYLSMPFGLSNAAQTFQPMMDCTIDSLEGVIAYMDDSRVGSPNRQTHLLHFEDFFNALATNGIVINLEKCIFAVPSLEISATRFWKQGGDQPPQPITPPKSDLAHPPPPQDIKQLQSFLGMVNFYRHFLPNCAQVLRPLTDLLKGGPKTSEWTAQAQEAFQNAKHLLVRRYQHPARQAELSLATNASNSHINGIMQQKSGDHWRPLGFFSRKLTDTESRYSTFNRELLAAHVVIRYV